MTGGMLESEKKKHSDQDLFWLKTLERDVRARATQIWCFQAGVTSRERNRVLRLSEQANIRKQDEGRKTEKLFEAQQRKWQPDRQNDAATPGRERTKKEF